MKRFVRKPACVRSARGGSGSAVALRVFTDLMSGDLVACGQHSSP